MLSLREMRRVAELLDRDLRGGRIQRIVAPEARRLVLSLHVAHRPDFHLLLCVEPDFARLSRLPARPGAPPKPGAFVQLLRARLSRARLAAVRIVDEDRQASLDWSTPHAVFSLLFSILGPRTNLYLLDEAERLVGALRPLADTRSELAVGEPWRSPESRPPGEGVDRFERESDEGFFAALEAHYVEREEREREEGLRRRVARALRRAEQSLARKMRYVQDDAAGEEEARQARRRGELLKSVLPQVRPGDRQARARDFESDEEVVIPLDPTLSPAANLESLFRRGRKAQRRAQRAFRELGALEATRDALAALRQEFEVSEAIADLAERPDVRRLLARYAPQAPRPAPSPRPGPARIGKHEVPRRLLPRRYRSSGGLEIWVGRSDEGNDLLTTRLARGRDLFFHVSASPGSHVVLRTGGRLDPPSEAVLEACELAVHASKQRNASRVDVLVAPIKNVRKPKEAKPGLVVVTGGKTVRLRRDPRRLERVLAARLE